MLIDWVILTNKEGEYYLPFSFFFFFFFGKKKTWLLRYIDFFFGETDSHWRQSFLTEKKGKKVIGDGQNFIRLTLTRFYDEFTWI